MKNSNEFAAMWRQKIEATIEREFGGVRGVFRRISIMEWMRRGKLPQFFLDSMTEAKDVAGAKLVESEMTAANLLEWQDLRRAFVIAATVAPVIVDDDERELAEGEVRYGELAERCPEVVDSIAKWVLAGSPDIPVSTKGGEETSIDEIANFRESGEEQPTVVPSHDVQAEQPTA
jgi:hypothetical protein